MSPVTNAQRKVIDAAMASISTTGYYGAALLSLRYIEEQIEQKIRPAMGIIQTIIEATHPIQTGQTYQNTFFAARKAGKSAKIAAKIATSIASKQAKSESEAMMSAFPKAIMSAYQAGAEYTLQRFEETSGYLAVETVNQIAQEIQIMAGRTNSNRKAMDAVANRVKAAQDNAHRQSIKRAFDTMATFNDPHKTPQQIREIGIRIEKHAQACLSMSGQTEADVTGQVIKAQAKAAARCFGQRIKAMRSMPRMMRMNETEKNSFFHETAAFIVMATTKPHQQRRMNKVMDGAKAKQDNVSEKICAEIEKMMDDATHPTNPKPTSRKVIPFIGTDASRAWARNTNQISVKKAAIG